jgi:hypothetical protein
MCSMRFSARLDTSNHGMPHPFKDAGVIAGSLIHPQCYGEVTLHSQQGLHTQWILGFPTDENPEDSNLDSWRPCNGSSSSYPSVMLGEHIAQHD